MAEIKPVHAWRYNSDLIKQVDELVSPLFDVVSESQREALYEKEHNSIHLSVPRGKDSIREAARKLIQWKQNGIIKQDETASYLCLLPALYATRIR